MLKSYVFQEIILIFIFNILHVCLQLENTDLNQRAYAGILVNGILHIHWKLLQISIYAKKSCSFKETM